MYFAKLQATGNDFILLDARDIEQDWSKLAMDMCHRHSGIGADGLILIMPSNYADLKMRIFNPDGSEAEVCGNGLRCFAKYVIDKQMIFKNCLTVETLAGTREIQAFISQGKVSRARIAMGKPRFKAEAIPVLIEPEKDRGEVDIMPLLDYPLDAADRQLAVSFVSMGNPHAVTFITETLVGFPLAELGPQVENHFLFPKRSNFEVARVLSRKSIEARVWERGAGETLSCGSGAGAIAVIARKKGFIDDEVDIILPGGELTIFWDGIGEVFLTGSVEEVFIGEWLK